MFVKYAITCAVPSAAFWAAWRGWQLMTTWDHRPAKGITPPSHDYLVAQVRRVGYEYHRLLGSSVAAKAHRLRAIQLAYDDVLRAAAAERGVDCPQDRPLSDSERRVVAFQVGA